MYNPVISDLQGLTITMKSPYVIVYVCQNFSVFYVLGKIPKSIHQEHIYLLPSDFPKKNFLSTFLFKQNER